MSVPAIILEYESAHKTLRVRGTFGAGDCVSIELVPAISGTQVISLQRAGVELAQDEITGGLGTIDLSTDALRRIFAGTPLHHTITADIQVHDLSGGLIGDGSVVIKNTADTFSVLSVAQAGVLSGTLDTALSAGIAVRRSAEGLIISCTAANAADFLGILSTGGAGGAVVKIVTAGVVMVPDWGLTPGATYYIARNSGAITAVPPAGYNVRRVGVAFDSSTLVLQDAPVIETATGDYLVYEATSRRFMMCLATAISEGAASSGRMVKLGWGGKLDATLLPEIDTDAAVAAVKALFADLADLADPTGAEKTTMINEILTRLRD